MNGLRLLMSLLVLTLLAAACTGSDQPDGGGTSTEGQVEAEGGTPGSEQGADGGGPALVIPVLDGAEIDVDQSILDAAATWVAEESGLSEMLQEELVLASADMTRDVHHLTYEQHHGGVAVRGAQLVVHVRDTGEVLASSQSLSTTLPGEGTTEELTEAEAIEVATKAVTGTVTAEPVVEAVWLESGTELRLGWQVRLVTDEPAEFAVVVDATSGEVLSVDRASSTAGHGGHGGREVAQAAACEAPAPPSACIFVVDPLHSSGQPTVDPAQTDQLLVGVPLENLTDPSGARLVGEYAQVLEAELDTFSDPEGVYGEGGRGGEDLSFHGGMVYYWIDYTQQMMQSVGYDFHAEDPVDILPIDPSFTDNAAYLPLLDLIIMGVSSNGQIALAEDAQVIVHEYGHAVVESVVPNIFTPEGGAFNEAFSDVLMLFTTLEFRSGDIGCMSAYFGQQLGLPDGGCIRRADSDKVYPEDLVQEVHLDGEIYSGAVWDFFEAVLERETGLAPDECQDRAANPCDEVRDEVLGTALGSLPFLTPQLTLHDAAAAMLASDTIFYGGRNAAEITEAFTAHGLDVEGSPMVQMSSGPMELEDLARSDAQVGVKITHGDRGQLGMQVSAVDPSGEPLCSVVLRQPTSDDVGEDVVGRFDLTGTPCEAHLPPSPERSFELVVFDLTPGETGQVLQFAIHHEGQSYLAGGVPQAIPDGEGVPAVLTIPSTEQSGGALPMMDPSSPGGGTPPGGGSPPAGGTAGSVEADIAISHTYIGDLDVVVVAVDAATSQALCAVEVLRSDPSNDSDDFSGTVDLSECAAYYPPSASHAWGLIAVDSAAQDVGQVDSFVLRGPDGAERSAGGPTPIPDADPEGAVVTVQP